MNCKLVCAFADFVLKVDWSMRSVIVHTLKLLHATINMYPCSKTNFYTGLHSALFSSMCMPGTNLTWWCFFLSCHISRWRQNLVRLILRGKQNCNSPQIKTSSNLWVQRPIPKIYILKRLIRCSFFIFYYESTNLSVPKWLTNKSITKNLSHKFPWWRILKVLLLYLRQTTNVHFFIWMPDFFFF